MEIILRAYMKNKGWCVYIIQIHISVSVCVTCMYVFFIRVCLCMYACVLVREENCNLRKYRK